MPKPGSTAARGYTGEHVRRRRADAKLVEAGGAVCWRCGRPIVPLKIRRADGRWVSNWHLGHDDFDRGVYRGPEHERCNTGAGGRKSGRRLRLRSARSVRGPLSS